MTVYNKTFDRRGHLYNAAMGASPNARGQEREHLLRRLAPRPNERILDAPAGGGFVADGLADSGAEIVCMEPSASFAEPLAHRYQTHIAPLWAMPLVSGSVDKVASLAGLHHLSDEELSGFFAEAFRVLRPGGIAVVADVRADTPVAAFLNGPVDVYTETGHDGRFFKPGALQGHLQSAGFDAAEETFEEFAWTCADTESLCRFVHGLFGLELLPLERTVSLLREHLGIWEDRDGAHLPWALSYATARKSANSAAHP